VGQPHQHLWVLLRIMVFESWQYAPRRSAPFDAPSHSALKAEIVSGQSVSFMTVGILSRCQRGVPCRSLATRSPLVYTARTDTSSELSGITAMLAATAFLVVGDSFMKLVTEVLPPFEVIFLCGIAASLACAVLLALRGEWHAISGVIDDRTLL
jgi:hypothetical protein